VWELVARTGIRQAGLELFVGRRRADVRAAAAASLGEPRSHFPDEDDYTAGGSWIRLRYDGEVLRDVEFLRGDLRLDGLALHGGVRWPQLRDSLAARGYAFEPAGQLAEGHECAALGVNIATHADVGGEGDGIEWVILSGTIARSLYRTAMSRERH
jgi:hypothetical protein